MLIFPHFLFDNLPIYVKVAIMKLLPTKSKHKNNLPKCGLSPSVTASTPPAGCSLIPLTQGKVALVDDEDFEWLSKFKWYAAKARNTYYAKRKVPSDKKGKQKTIFMHRAILRRHYGLFLTDKQETDHRDWNGLNNRKANLRICTTAENLQNQRPQYRSKSKYKGISRPKDMKKWRACIQINGKQIHLGYFDDEIEAAKIYDHKAKELFGEFAHTNF